MYRIGNCWIERARILYECFYASGYYIQRKIKNSSGGNVAIDTEDVAIDTKKCSD